MYHVSLFCGSLQKCTYFLFTNKVVSWVNSVKEATAAQSACLTAKVTLLAGGGYSLQNAGTVKARRTAAVPPAGRS